ncbi:MAG: hypothetical protein IPK94_08070 [Saprospiraceae bacterium]|nr:hypothetical protein [Saprospiraceae bacterium]
MQYLGTPEGDGSVTWALGIPKTYLLRGYTMHIKPVMATWLMMNYYLMAFEI